jgi:hypothetical protein
MGVIKKIKKEEVQEEAVLQLVTEKQGYEVALGSNYYKMYPLPATRYAKLMGSFRSLWYSLLADKENKYADTIEAAKALSQNIGEIDDQDVRLTVQDLMMRLTESKEVHPLEFLTHEKFAREIKDILEIMTEGADKGDLEELTIEQLARLLEVCFIQNFLPFIRLANTANRVFRGDHN